MTHLTSQDRAIDYPFAAHYKSTIVFAIDCVGGRVKLEGVIPANLLPFDDDLAIDEAGYRAHLGSLVDIEGVTGLTCNGHAGEVSSLSPREWQLALEIAVEVAAGRVPVICGLLADSEGEALEQARTAAATGADALLVFPPEFLRYSDDPETAHRYFAALASEVSIPLVAFMYPAFTGLGYSAEDLRAICAIDRVIALKDWSLDISVYERNLTIVRSASHEISMLTSFSTHLLPSLSIGADGILSGHGSVIAPLQVALLQAVRQGDLQAAQASYERIQRLTGPVYRNPMPNMYARMKEQLVMLGSSMTSRVRPPLRQVSADERIALRSALGSAGLIPAGTR